MKILRKRTLAACALLVFYVLSASLAQAQITGDREVPAGRLAVFHSAAAASWTVMPDDVAAGCYMTTNGGKTLVFASPTHGKFTLLAATVKDNAPTLSAFTFTNGSGNSPEPQPLPAPEVKLTESEKKKLSSALTATVTSIDAGRITTPQGASIYLDRQIGKDMTVAMNAYLAAFTKSADTSSIQGVRASFEKGIKELQ